MPMYFQRNLQGNGLECPADCDMVVIQASFTADLQSVPYPYTFKTNDEAPEKLGAVLQAGTYA